MKSSILTLLFIVCTICACKQEAINFSYAADYHSLQAFILGDINSETDKEQDGKEDKNTEDCFTLIYPLSITLPDATVITGDEGELWDAVKAWYAAHPDSAEKPNLNYPVEINWAGEVVKTVNNKDEMILAKKYCHDNKESKKDCFELVYPTTWTMPDGSMITMSDKEDWVAIKAWYEDHFDSEAKPDLNYPVDIVLKDGSTQTISNEDEIISIKENCE